MLRATILFLSGLLLCILATHSIALAQTMTFTPADPSSYDSWEPEHIND